MQAEALPADSGVKTCTFEGSSFRTERIGKSKTEEQSCQGVCAGTENCIIWREKDTTICNLTVFKVKNDSNKIAYSGISNCKMVSDKAPLCGGKRIELKDAKLSKQLVSETKDKEACETKCEGGKKCILWEFSLGSKCKHFNLEEKDEPSSASSTYGIRYCSTPATTTTTKTTTTTTTKRPCEIVGQEYNGQIIYPIHDVMTWEACGKESFKYFVPTDWTWYNQDNKCIIQEKDTGILIPNANAVTGDHNCYE